MDADFVKALADLKSAQEDKAKLGPVSEIAEIRKKFRKAVDKTKREQQILEEKHKTPTGRTRSSKLAKKTHRAIYSSGKYVNKGIDDAEEVFDNEEKDYIKKAISRIKKVSDLKTEHIKYLVIDILLEDLKDIKSGKIQSDFHDRYHSGEAQVELQSEIRTSLFTNEQRDYISGLLQGAFKTTIKDANDDIKHSEINYVEIVMLYECIARIVQNVHKFETVKEALNFIRKRSREASGIHDEEEEDL